MIHRLLQQIHVNRPTMSGLFMTCLINAFPNVFKEDANAVGGYVMQLMKVTEYIPSLRPQIIRLIVEKMILIDVEIEKHHKHHQQQTEEIEMKDANNDRHEDQDEDISDEEEEEEDNVLITNLDQLMCLMFEYLKLATDNTQSLTELYQILSRIFETSILSTYEVCYFIYILHFILYCSFIPL